MAKGKEEYEARVAALQLFGKDLARRAKSKCELCEKGGETLSIFEVPLVPREPDFARCVMLCRQCREAIEDPKSFRAGEQWRFLTQSVWSELPPVQVLAVRLLMRMKSYQAWAQEALETVYLDEEVETWVTEAA